MEKYIFFESSSLLNFLENFIICPHCIKKTNFDVSFFRTGLANSIKMKCCNCGKVIEIPTASYKKIEENKKNEGGKRIYQINEDFVKATQLSGINFEKIEMFSLYFCMNMLSRTYFFKKSTKFWEEIYEIGQNECSFCREKLCKNKLIRAVPLDSMLPYDIYCFMYQGFFFDISLDGAWLSRRNALECMVDIYDIDSGKCMYFIVVKKRRTERSDNEKV